MTLALLANIGGVLDPDIGPDARAGPRTLQPAPVPTATRYNHPTTGPMSCLCPDVLNETKLSLIDSPFSLFFNSQSLVSFRTLGHKEDTGVSNWRQRGPWRRRAAQKPTTHC